MNRIIKFMEYCFENKIGKSVYNIGNDFTNRLSFDEHNFKLLSNFCKISNLDNNGLILGATHEYGGIQLLIKIKKPINEYIYFLHGEIEGYEYFSYIYDDYKKGELQSINLRHTSKGEILDEKSRLILENYNCDRFDMRITSSNQKYAVLIVEDLDFYIINKVSTSKYIDEIIKINT